MFYLKTAVMWRMRLLRSSYLSNILKKKKQGGEESGLLLKIFLKKKLIPRQLYGKTVARNKQVTCQRFLKNVALQTTPL